MAADRAAIASGADVGDGLRKRPVNNGTPTPATPQPQDNKKQVAKKVRPCADEAEYLSRTIYEKLKT